MPQPTDFSFIHISDHHIPDSEATLLRGFSPAYAFRQVMRHIAANVAEPVDFLVTTGDLVDRPSEDAYRTFGSLLNLTTDSAVFPGPITGSLDGLRDLPVYCLPGNHDDRQSFYRFLFPNQPPLPLANATFVHKGVQFICLDMGPQTKAKAHPETLDFLARSLQTPLPSIILMHHHPSPIGYRWLDDFIADDVDQFWSAVTGKHVIGIFCGHVHTSYEKIIHGIPLFGVRSTAFPFAQQDEPLIALVPPHYRLVVVKDGFVATRVYEVPL